MANLKRRYRQKRKHKHLYSYKPRRVLTRLRTSISKQTFLRPKPSRKFRGFRYLSTYSRFLLSNSRPRSYRLGQPGFLSTSSTRRQQISRGFSKPTFRFNSVVNNDVLAKQNLTTSTLSLLWFPEGLIEFIDTTINLRGFYTSPKQLNTSSTVSFRHPKTRLLSSRLTPFTSLPIVTPLVAIFLNSELLSLPFIFKSSSLSHKPYSQDLVFTQFQRLSRSIDLRRRLVRQNLLKLKRTRNYTIFYTYFSPTVDQRDRTFRILIPDIAVTPRGSFWSPLFSGSSLEEPVVSRGTKSKRLVSPNNFHSLLRKRPSPRSRIKSLSTLKLKVPYNKDKPKNRQSVRLLRRMRSRLKRIRWIRRRRSGRFRWLLRKFRRRSAGKNRRLRRGRFFQITRKRRHRSSRKFGDTVINVTRRRLFRRKPRNAFSDHEALLAEIQLSRVEQPSPRVTQLLKYTDLISKTQISSLPLISSPVTPVNLSLQHSSTTNTWLYNLNLLTSFWSNPFLLKYNLSRGQNWNTSLSSFHSSALRFQNQLQQYVFSAGLGRVARSNLWVVPSSNYTIRKKLLRSTSSSLINVDLSLWYYKSLTAFIEECSGRKVALRIGPFLEGALTFEDKARFRIMHSRVSGFQRLLGHKIFVHEGVMLVALALRLKDPTFLSNWIRGMLRRMSFWKYRLLFRYLRFLFQNVFRPNFGFFGMRGFKLRLKGKISVAGNARTRTLFYKIGDTSHSKMSNKVAYDLNYVNTFTGVMGFKLWFFY